MSSASSSLGAITAAIGSPTKRTTPSARIGCADRLVIELVQHRRDRLHALEIGGGDHHRARRRVDLVDLARRRPGCARSAPSARRQIGGEAAVAGDQRRVFQPADGAADPGRCRMPLVSRLRSCGGSAPARGAPPRAPGRAGIRRWSDDPPADRSASAAASAAARKTSSPGAWPFERGFGLARCGAGTARRRRRRRGRRRSCRLAADR